MDIKRFAKPFAALAIIGFLSGCGGGTLMHGATPSTPNASKSDAKDASVAFTIHWNSNAKAPAWAKAHRDFISASAKSLSVSVNGGPPQIVNKSSTLPTSSIVVDAPVGADAFTVETWDEPAGDGNILDQATATQIIVADKLNTLSATLNGVCAGFLIQPSSTSPFFQSTSTTANVDGNPLTVYSSFTLLGASPQTLKFVPIDIDGNIIVAAAPPVATIEETEAGQPSTTITQGSLSTSGSTSSYTFTPNSTTDPGPVTVTATSPDCTGGSVAVPNHVALQLESAIYVPNINGSVTVYDQNGNQLALSGNFANTSNPAGSAYDRVNGNIFISNVGNQSITEYSRSGVQVSLASGSFPGLNYPYGIAFDPGNGQIYAANFANNTVTVYNQSGKQITTASGTFANLSGPAGITYDPINGYLYVANYSANTITAYDSAGDETVSGSFANLNQPEQIAFDPNNGDLYVTNVGNNTITVYDANGNQISTGGFSSLVTPVGIGFNSLNNQFYAANTGNNQMTVYDQYGDLEQLSPAAFPNLNESYYLTIIPITTQTRRARAANKERSERRSTPVGANFDNV